MMAIGLYMVGDLPNVVSGARDANITLLGDFIKDVGNPVFLRIGYEFDGSWNGYDKTLYVQAFRRIMDRLRAEGVTNVVSVWQSSGFTTNKSSLLQWYPGDDYVDWVGYSYFKQSNPSGGMMTIARERRKPVMIAEATPQRNLSLGDPDHALEHLVRAVLRAHPRQRRHDQGGRLHQHALVRPAGVGRGLGRFARADPARDQGELDRRDADRHLGAGRLRRTPRNEYVLTDARPDAAMT